MGSKTTTTHFQGNQWLQHKPSYEYLGRLDYPEAVQLMEEHIERDTKEERGYWWGLEHNLVYTAGLSTLPEHILDSELVVTPSRRGGSVTVHNLGQLIFYSVFPISMVYGGLQGYIRFLEASIIETLWEYGVSAFLLPPHSGVWTSRGKIAFVGLAMKKNMIYHGVAINLTNDLNDYQKIYSCGLTLPVSKLEDETNIIGETVVLEQDQILEGFSFRLKQNLETRFANRRGREFRDYVATKIEQFPDTMLAFRFGQLFFNERRYWEAHEAWEAFWHKYKEGEFKRFLGGLIQLASALYKLTLKPNLKGAMSLLEKSFIKLKSNRYVDIYLSPFRTQASLGEYSSIIDYIEQSIQRIKLFRLSISTDNLIQDQEKEQEEEIQAQFLAKKREIFKPYLLITPYDQPSV